MDNKENSEYITHCIDGYKVLEYEKKNVYVIENIVGDEFCNKIIEFINSGVTLNCSLNDNGNALKCYYLHLTRYIEEHKQYDFMIYEIVRKIFLIIKKVNKYFCIDGDLAYHLRKIFGPTILHTDGVRPSENGYIYNQIRNIALIINLNDDYDGGEFNFPVQCITYKLKKGSAILFPPYWTHPHQVYELGKDQFRYTITTWSTESYKLLN